MATPNYDIDYNAKPFQEVEADKKAALTENEQLYGGMISQSDKFYQQQIDAAQQYADKQTQLQNQQTDFAIEQINQQKEQAKQDYTKEQSGAYVDWQKQSNQYGVNAEQQAAQGMTNTGFSESSQVSMYNTYQNRVATARESYNRAVLNYDNAIKDARLQNNALLAEIAYQALQTQLELSLEGFQYKNTLLIEQANKKLEIDNTYYSRYQDVLNQINTENAMAENIRQYEQSFAEDQRQFNENMEFKEKEYAEGVRQFNAELAEKKRQFNEDYELQVKKYNEDIRQFNEEIARLKAKDAKEYEVEIKNLELKKDQVQLQKDQLAEEKRQFEEQMEEEQRQFDKQMEEKSNPTPAKKYSGGGAVSSGKLSSGSGLSRVTAVNKDADDADSASAYSYLNQLIASGASKDKVANEISIALAKGKITANEAMKLRNAFTPRGVQY